MQYECYETSNTFTNKLTIIILKWLYYITTLLLLCTIYDENDMDTMPNNCVSAKVEFLH